jgi:hypothetical protein
MRERKDGRERKDREPGRRNAFFFAYSFTYNLFFFISLSMRFSSLAVSIFVPRTFTCISISQCFLLPPHVECVIPFSSTLTRTHRPSSTTSTMCRRAFRPSCVRCSRSCSTSTLPSTRRTTRYAWLPEAENDSENESENENEKIENQNENQNVCCCK